MNLIDFGDYVSSSPTVRFTLVVLSEMSFTFTFYFFNALVYDQMPPQVVLKASTLLVNKQMLA